jgi:predicted TIM-barrel fold metal-dependent hydrolase
MFGSDGFGIPEVFWFAAVQGKIEVWAALEDLVERDWLLRKEAVEVMGKIFSENARRVYGLD